MGYEKVFSVGLNKTGSSSMKQALKDLGFKVPYIWSTAHPKYNVNRSDLAEVALDLCLEVTNTYDAFVQHPWAWLWEEWATRYPDAKFILTVRDPWEWIKSQVRYFGTEETEMRRWVYGHGSPIGHEFEYLRVFGDHNRRVQEELGDRCLVFNVFEGDGWGELCGFLEMKLPKRAFPHHRPI